MPVLARAAYLPVLPYRTVAQGSDSGLRGGHVHVHAVMIHLSLSSGSHSIAPMEQAGRQSEPVRFVRLHCHSAATLDGGMPTALMHGGRGATEWRATKARLAALASLEEGHHGTMQV